MYQSTGSNILEELFAHEANTTNQQIITEPPHTCQTEQAGEGLRDGVRSGWPAFLSL